MNLKQVGQLKFAVYPVAVGVVFQAVCGYHCEVDGLAGAGLCGEYRLLVAEFRLV